MRKFKKLFALLTIAAFTSIAVAQQQPVKTASKAKAEQKDDHCKKGKDCCKAPSKAAAMMAAPKQAAPAKKS